MLRCGSAESMAVRWSLAVLSLRLQVLLPISPANSESDSGPAPRLADRLTFQADFQPRQFFESKGSMTTVTVGNRVTVGGAAAHSSESPTASDDPSLSLCPFAAGLRPGNSGWRAAGRRGSSCRPLRPGRVALASESCQLAPIICEALESGPGP